MSLFKKKSEGSPKTTEVTCKNLNGNSECDLIHQIKELKATNAKLESLIEDKKDNNYDASKYIVWVIARAHGHIRRQCSIPLSDFSRYIKDLSDRVYFPPSNRELIYSSTAFINVRRIVCEFIDSFESENEFKMFIGALQTLFNNRKYINDANKQTNENTHKINELKKELGI